MGWGVVRGRADGHGKLVRQGADSEALLASLEELVRQAKGMERARLEAEMRAADLVHKAQARISRQVRRLPRRARHPRGRSARGGGRCGSR